MNASAQRHPWYDQCGNDVLYYHAQTGALDAIKDWSAAGNIPNESLPPTSKEKKNCFTLLFVTGGVYVDYMVNRSVPLHIQQKTHSVHICLLYKEFYVIS